MCGIAIAIGWENAEDIVGRLIGGLMHRGDITDPVVSPLPNTAMGTRRLRIVDGENAVQPQVSSDGRLVVALNGEIYNYRELRQELIALGYSFKTNSDTEVLATALLKWGAGALERISGMYAFVAFDLQNGEFLAARDPLGIKPLYLIHNNNRYLFCSEIKPLLAATEEGSVLPLPPGHLMSGKILGAFKSPLVLPPTLVAGNVRQLDQLMREAVGRHLPPDLPVASIFSGGIDSTLLTHYAREIRPEIPGYFLGNPGAPDYEFATRYAEQTDLDLRIVPFNESDQDVSLIDTIVSTVEAFEPEMIRSSLCTYLVSEKVHRDGYRVALCGEGADELFCGYRPMELLFSESNSLGREVRDQNLAQMSRTNLQRVDRCSMHFELETRVPFLDPTLINYALSLESTALVEVINDDPRGKAPLRALYDLYPDQLPTSIRDRAKVQFNQGAGFDRLKRGGPWTDYAEETISDKDYADGKKEFAPYDIQNKEELLYLRSLSRHMDINRVPSLKDRARMAFPTISRMDRLADFVQVIQ